MGRGGVAKFLGCGDQVLRNLAGGCTIIFSNRAQENFSILLGKNENFRRMGGGDLTPPIPPGRATPGYTSLSLLLQFSKNE